MSPSERTNNSHFKDQYLNELKILSKHCNNQECKSKKEETKEDSGPKKYLNINKENYYDEIISQNTRNHLSKY